ncbi:MAG: DUF4198 domain-containing protein [Caldimicrobium sp.]
MLKLIKLLFFLLCFTFGYSQIALAHFLTIFSEDFYIQEPSKAVKIEILFTHPIEQGPHMPFSLSENAMICGEEKLFLNLNKKELKPLKGVKGNSYILTFSSKKPSLCLFYVKQEPYFEASEGKFIQQIAKAVFSFYGLEEGWDKPLGLPVEIIPYVKPFALYEGNTFIGRVLIDGKPASNIEIEVEYYNTLGLKPPHAGFVPQVVKTDEDGFFSYTFPFPGLWGFSALTERGTIKGKDEKDYPLELDGVFWLKVYPKPKKR